MKESSVYQEILQEGEERGMLKGELRLKGYLQQLLMFYLKERFAEIPPEVGLRIQNITDVSVLQSALEKVNHISSPDELML